jgi:hypothetical protein
MPEVRVLNPQGYPPRITRTPMAPRLDGLDGKKIFLVDPRFDDSGLFMNQLQQALAKHLPGVQTELVQMASVYSRDDPQLWERIKTEGDAAIIGVGH